MVELVDTGDLKSPGYCSCAGSSPAPGTTKKYKWRHSQVAKAGACKALIPGSNPGVASIIWLCCLDDIYTHHNNCREMAERLNALVLKTSEGHTSGSSNLPLPATYFRKSKIIIKLKLYTRKSYHDSLEEHSCSSSCLYQHPSHYKKDKCC